MVHKGNCKIMMAREQVCINIRSCESEIPKLFITSRRQSTEASRKKFEPIWAFGTSILGDNLIWQKLPRRKRIVGSISNKATWGYVQWEYSRITTTSPKISMTCCPLNEGVRVPESIYVFDSIPVKVQSIVNRSCPKYWQKYKRSTWEFQAEDGRHDAGLEVSSLVFLNIPEAGDGQTTVNYDPAGRRRPGGRRSGK